MIKFLVAIQICSRSISVSRHWQDVP